MCVLYTATIALNASVRVGADGQSRTYEDGVVEVQDEQLLPLARLVHDVDLELVERSEQLARIPLQQSRVVGLERSRGLDVLKQKATDQLDDTMLRDHRLKERGLYLLRGILRACSQLGL